MSRRATLATARRLLEQLRRDPRTLALIIGVPLVLLGLLKLVFQGREHEFQQIAPPLLGIFPLTVMFLVTSVTMLRERTSGTLERLMTMPMSRGDLVAGYALAFALVAAVQGTVASGFAIVVLGLDVQGSTLALVALAVLNAELGMACGLGLSSLATTEFQAVQFMPAFILPQLLLCGLIVPRDQMAPGLEALSKILPMTYAYEGLADVAAGDGSGAAAAAAVTLGFCALALALGALTLRRRTA
ncbi:MAG TPA: ABC transporter permease [Solirubrobacteraceae bacterium]|nr:ABC transporter permease [Solirubrobacteraceae bacterium]